MTDGPQIRLAVRVLLLDEHDRLLLFRAVHPETRDTFWFPTGGGLEDGEDVYAAAEREVAEETGLTGVVLGPEVWHRRHRFSWRGLEWEQRERWFLSRVTHFDADGAGMTESEKIDLTECRWWTIAEMKSTTERLTPRDLAAQLGRLLTDGPPSTPMDVGV